MVNFAAAGLFRLDHKIVLITGATGHLGQAISKGIAQAGGIAVLCGRDQEKLAVLATAINYSYGQAYSKCFDLEDLAACRLIMQELRAQFGLLHGIVNCAYGGKTATIAGAEPSDFLQAHTTQVLSPFFLIREGLDLLKAAARDTQGGASIVNVASMYGVVSPDPKIYADSGSNNPPFYGVAKAGLLQLTRYLACHLGEHNIRVNSLSPGPFPTVQVQNGSQEFYHNLCVKNPLGRVGEATEMIGPIIFFLSGASSFVTGANLAIDGGWTAW